MRLGDCILKPQNLVHTGICMSPFKPKNEKRWSKVIIDIGIFVIRSLYYEKGYFLDFRRDTFSKLYLRQ